jgi:hypothetical protein
VFPITEYPGLQVVATVALEHEIVLVGHYTQRFEVAFK